MKKNCAAIAIIALLALTACSSAPKTKASDASGAGILESSENMHAYLADYDTTFRAALDALRRAETGSARFVKRSKGVIIFKKPEDSGVITVRVEKMGDQRTRVEISAKNRRKYWLDGGDKKTRDAFFEELDELLGVAPAEEDAADADGSKQVAQGQAAAEKAPDKGSILGRLKQELQLDAGESFLDRLSYDDLTLLDQKLESLISISDKNKKLTQRCAACYIDLARYYHNDGQYSRSAEALKIAISIDSDNAVAHCNLGEIYKHLGLYEEALRELDEAKRLDPEFPDTFVNLGIIYDDYLADNPKALENYKKFLNLGGDDEQVLEWIAEIEQNS